MYVIKIYTISPKMQCGLHDLNYNSVDNLLLGLSVLPSSHDLNKVGEIPNIPLSVYHASKSCSPL